MPRVTDDYEAIRKLCFQYTFLVDAGDFTGLAELISPGSLRPMMVGDIGAPLTTTDAIRDWYASQVVTYRNGDPRTRHLVTNQYIEIDTTGLSATSRSYFTVLQRPPRNAYAIVVGGQYFDSFAKAGGRWQFVEKMIQVDHLNANIADHFVVSPERDPQGKN